VNSVSRLPASALLFVLLISAHGHAGDEKPDFHLEADPAWRLFQISTFAHGYIHGYEHGFRIADLDLHFGRSQRNLEEHPDYKQADAEFRGEFGDRSRFRHGFQRGMMAGYADGIAGGRYTAVASTRAIGSDSTLPEKREPSEASLFDLSFAAGYEAGIKPGLEGSDQETDVCRQSAEEGPENEDGREKLSRDGYCRGFKLGLADGLRSHGEQMRARK
jgi:hypothetical protein